MLGHPVGMGSFGFLPLKHLSARFTRPAGAGNRARGLFPLPTSLPESLKFSDSWSLSDLEQSEIFSISQECWLAVSCAAINSYYGCPFSLTCERAGKIHGAVLENLRQLIKRFLTGVGIPPFSFDDVGKDLKEKRVSYTGEEISLPSPLSVSQILPGLPARSWSFGPSASFRGGANQTPS